METLCLDGCPSTYFFIPRRWPTIDFYWPTAGTILCLIKARSCKTSSARPPFCTFHCVICVHWVGWQPLHLTCHAPMRTQKRQVAVLGRVHTKSRAKHTSVCAVARGIHRSFRSAIRVRTEGARSAGVNRRSYPISVRDARKACRLRATRRRLRATLGRRQGAKELRATPRRLEI